jgi:hypothetical protein
MEPLELTPRFLLAVQTAHALHARQAKKGTPVPASRTSSSRTLGPIVDVLDAAVEEMHLLAGEKRPYPPGPPGQPGSPASRCRVTVRPRGR